MIDLLRKAIQIFLARPIAKFVIGMDVIGRDNLPTEGPVIVAANHNSHIDTLILLSLFSTKVLHNVRQVGAADHFLKTRMMSWISINIIGMIPIHRKKAGQGEDLLADSRAALEAGRILVVFPEGTRGEAEEMAGFKTGVARLAKDFPDIPVVPIYIQGAGRVLPRGSKLLVPFNCTAVVGEPINWASHSDNDRHIFMENLKVTIQELSTEASPLRWD